MKQVLFVWMAMVLATIIVKADTPTFYWDCETKVPNICNGGSCEPHYSAGAHLSTEQAFSGDQSLKNEGAWSQGGVHNFTTEDCWAPLTEGTMELDWQYWGPYSQRMLFQFSGDWTDSEYDHNDGISLKTRSENEFQLGYGYSSTTGEWKTVYFRVTVPMVEGKWYHIVAKYKQGRGMELRIDDQTFSKSVALDGLRTDRVFHNICFGNDLKYACTQYLDNITIYDHWVEDGTTDISHSIQGADAVSQKKADIDQSVLYNRLGARVSGKLQGPGVYFAIDNTTGRPVKVIHYSR